MTSVREILFGILDDKPQPVIKKFPSLRRDQPHKDLARTPIRPMSDRGYQNDEGLFAQDPERIADCREQGTHIWVRSILTTYRTAHGLTDTTPTRYYRDEESVFWCEHCGHSLRSRQREAKKIPARDYFQSIKPSIESYQGIDPKHILGWNYATGHDEVHSDWEQEAFLNGGWT